MSQGPTWEPTGKTRDEIWRHHLRLARLQGKPRLCGKTPRGRYIYAMPDGRIVVAGREEHHGRCRGAAGMAGKLALPAEGISL